MPYVRQMKVWKVALVLILGTALLAFAFLLAATTPILKSALDTLSGTFKRDYGLELTFGEVRTSGLLSVEVAPFSLATPDGKLLVRAQRIKVDLSILGYLFDSIPIRTIDIEAPDVFVAIDLDSPTSFSNISFALEKIRIRDGQVHLRLNDHRVSLTDVNVQMARIRRKYRVDLSVGNSLVAVGKQVFDIEGASTQIDVLAKELFKPKQLELRRFYVRTPEGEIGADGMVRLGAGADLGVGSNLSVRGRGQVDRLAKIFPLPLWLAGQIAFSGRLQNQNTSDGWQFDGSLEGNRIEVEDMQFDSFATEAVINKHHLEIQRGEVDIGGTTAHVSGRANFDKNINFALNVDARHVSLYDLLFELGVRFSWTELGIDLNAQAVGQMLPRFSLSALSQGNVYDLLVADGPVRDVEHSEVILRTAHRIQFASELVFDRDSLRFKDTHLDDGYSHGLVDCTIFFDKRRGMRLQGLLERADLASIGYEIVGNRFEGVGRVSATIDGAYEDLTIDAAGQVNDLAFENFFLGNVVADARYFHDRLAFDNVRARVGKSQYQGSLAFLFGDLVNMDLKASVKKARVEDLRGMIPQHPPFPILGYFRDLPWAGSVNGDVHVEGPIKKGYRSDMTGVGEIQLQHDNGIFGKPIEDGIVKFHIDKEKFHVDLLSLSAPSGAFDVKGAFDKKNGEISAQIEIAQFDLSQLTLKELESVGLSGRVNMNAQVNGKLGELSGTGKLSATAVEGAGMSVGDVELDLSLSKQVLSTKGSLFSSRGYVDLQLTPGGEWPFTGSIKLQYVPLRQILTKIEVPEQLDWYAGAQLEFEGRARDLQQTRGKISLYPAVINYAGLKLMSVGEVNASFIGPTLNIERFVLQTSHGDSLRVQGQITKDKVNCRLKAMGDLWVLPFFDDRLDAAYGDFFADVLLYGDINNPSLKGVGQIDRGYISLRDYPPGIENLTLLGRFDDHRVHLSKFQGQVEKGSFEGQGNLMWSQYLPSEYDVGFRFQQIPIHLSSWLTGLSSGNLQLKGAHDDLVLSGNIRILEALISREINWENFAAEFNSSPPIVDARHRRGRPLQFDIHVTGNKGIVIESSSLNAELAANLHVVGTKDTPGLRGSLTMLSGEAYFRNHHYRLHKARADFDDPYRIWPNIDVDAEGRIGEYDVLARLQGTLDGPRFQLSSRPFLPEADVVNLVTLGFTSSEMRNVMGTARTAGLEALTAYTGIGQKLIQLLPESMQRSRMMNVDELRLTSLFSHRGGVSLPALMVGVDVWNGMRLRLQSALVENEGGTREQRLELEQNLNRAVRWRLVWNSEGQSNYGDAGVDLWYRWEF